MFGVDLCAPDDRLDSLYEGLEPGEPKAGALVRLGPAQLHGDETSELLGLYGSLMGLVLGLDEAGFALCLLLGLIDLLRV